MNNRCKNDRRLFENGDTETTLLLSEVASSSLWSVFTKTWNDLKPPTTYKEQGWYSWLVQEWHSWLVRGLGARGPEFDPRISHPCFDFFPFSVA